MHRKFTIACLHKKKCPALFGFQIKLKFSWLNSTSHIHINKQWNLSSELFVIPMYLLKIYIVQFGIHFFLVCVQKSLYNYDKFHGSLYIHNVNEYHGLLRFVTLKQGTAPFGLQVFNLYECGKFRHHIALDRGWHTTESDWLLQL